MGCGLFYWCAYCQYTEHVCLRIAKQVLPMDNGKELMKTELRALLSFLGWTACSPIAISSKKIETAAGGREAVIYLEDFGVECKNFILAGDYQSEGRNVLEPHGMLIPKSSNADDLKTMVGSFVLDIEKVIDSTYAVRLLKLK